ncbi:hypothetical protein TSMEX_005623, partial [Taenia solium]
AFVNLDEFACEDLVAWSQIWNDLLMMDQRVQIGGVVFIMDLQGITKEQICKMERGNKCQLGAQYFQIIKADKDMSNAYEAIPGLKDLMPSEYGGTRGSYEEIWGETEDTIRSISQNLPNFIIDINTGRQAETSSGYTHGKAEVATESHELCHRSDNVMKHLLPFVWQSIWLADEDETRIMKKCAIDASRS